MHLPFRSDLETALEYLDEDHAIGPMRGQVGEVTEEKQRDRCVAVLVDRLLLVARLAGLGVLTKFLRPGVQVDVMLRRCESVFGLSDDLLGILLTHVEPLLIGCRHQSFKQSTGCSRRGPCRGCAPHPPKYALMAASVVCRPIVAIDLRLGRSFGQTTTQFPALPQSSMPPFFIIRSSRSSLSTSPVG